MSFDDQPHKRKVSIFKQALRFQEVAAGVFVQRVPVQYLARLYGASADDPVAIALRNLDTIFAGCKSKSVDMASSVEAILAEHAEDRKSHGVVFLAWATSFDANARQMTTPTLVGLATVSDFVSTSNYSTDRGSLSTNDYATLSPLFGNRYSYIDALCSTRPGVGRLLILHAYNYALAQRKAGLVALAFSSRRATVPESKRIFSSLGFDVLIPDANFTTRLYGTWDIKRASAVDLSGLAAAAVRVCTRSGLTPKTADSLLWRCPS